jgi:GT2 family glycosyltransferase
VVLADDASPLNDIEPVAQHFIERGRLSLRYVRRERNLGFIGNVNRALRESAPDDVVLLNSDTVVTPGWLQGLLRCAESDPSIATITPWSNNAEICSFPDFCRSGPVPAELEIVAAAAADSAPSYPELPTGVGFCMYLRRAALDRIGDLDQATFGRGYGEENDLCLRAAAHGWKNVLCDDVYVAHRGGASFSPAGLSPGGENLARLNARYPGYNALIADYILRDPLRTLREAFAQRLEQARLAAPPHDLFG